MDFLFPNPAIPNTGYDDGYFGPTAVAVALHELAARKSGVERFLVAGHHTSGDSRIYETFTVRYGKIDGEPRFRYSDGAGEASLGNPTTPVEISRAVGHLVAMAARPNACIYRVGT